MKDDAKAQSDIAAITNDLASLKSDFASLMEHLRTGGVVAAKGTAQDAIDRISDQTHKLYQNLANQGEESAKALARRVEEQPLTTLLLAFGIGLISGRLLSR